MVETTNVYLTEHAYLRMKERLGLNKSAADKLAKRAWKRGLYGDCVKGRLSTYLFSKSETAVSRPSDSFAESIYLYFCLAQKKFV